LAGKIFFERRLQEELKAEVRKCKNKLTTSGRESKGKEGQRKNELRAKPPGITFFLFQLSDFHFSSSAFATRQT